jgi:SSS family solute:Na+ symporter
MHWIDWSFIFLTVAFVAWVGLYTRRYMKSVADFLSGNRLAGRYLLAVARGEIGAGAVSFVAAFEVVSRAGFTVMWWQWVNIPVSLLVSISGFVVYRFRQTRAMTLAQFFEIRYSKSFRIFTGMLGFLAGVINFGIIPVVGARFMVYFLGLPPVLRVASFEFPTLIPLMVLMLAITLALTLAGGLITLMVTNCVEGMISQLIFIALIIGLMVMFKWSDISEAMMHVVTATGSQVRPVGHSLVNPFDSLGLKDLNVWFVLMSMFVGVYGTMAWQNQSAYNSAASSAHESRMAGLLRNWREIGVKPVMTLLGVCAMAFLVRPEGALVRSQLEHISEPQIRTQMEIPIAVVEMLPVGLKGALCVVMLMGIWGGDGSHLHSWGSLFIQDVIVPLRKKAFTPKGHIRALRASIIGVALFAFVFGSLFQQTEYIVIWWQVTMAIYVGGAGAAIIGGLYWKRGTTAGAWSGMVAGSVLTTAGMVLRQIYGSQFPLNGMEISFYATLIAIALYVVVSYLTSAEDFPMDQMLHRGKYAKVGELEQPNRTHSRLNIRGLLGIDAEFTVGDKWTTGVLFGWGMLWFVVLIVGSVWNWFAPWSNEAWLDFWYVVAIIMPVAWALVGTVWFTWGGIVDMVHLFQKLKTTTHNSLDNGVVVGHQNLDEKAGSAVPPASVLSLALDSVGRSDSK